MEVSIVLRNDSNVYLKSDVIVNKYLVERSNLHGVLACTKGISTWNIRRMIDLQVNINIEVTSFLSNFTCLLSFYQEKEATIRVCDALSKQKKKSVKLKHLGLLLPNSL